MCQRVFILSLSSQTKILCRLAVTGLVIFSWRKTKTVLTHEAIDRRLVRQKTFVLSSMHTCFLCVYSCLVTQLLKLSVLLCDVGVLLKDRSGNKTPRWPLLIFSPRRRSLHFLKMTVDSGGSLFPCFYSSHNSNRVRHLLWSSSFQVNKSLRLNLNLHNQTLRRAPAKSVRV